MSYYYVSSGVTSTGVSVSNGDYLIVSEGGVAITPTIGCRGVLQVYTGGTATEIDWTPCEGVLYIDPGAHTTFASSYTGVYYGSDGYLLGSAEVWDSSEVASDWRVCVMNGGIASNTYIHYADLEVYSGGVASSISMSWYGRCSVYSGGSANDVIVGDRGDMTVASGGTATNIKADGTVYVRAGASADKIKVNGGLYVNSGGTATEIDWTPCEGGLTIEDGAYVTFSSEYSGVYYGVYGQLKSNAATMENMNLASGSGMFVMADGVANSITIGAYGAEMIIWSGGVANDATGNGGYIRVSSGGIANNAMINANCYIFVSSGGTANNTTVNQYGHLVVSSGGTADGASVNNDGNIQVSSGGSANDVKIDSGGTLYVSSGGTATNVDWTPSVGHVQVYEGGTATFTSEYSGVYYGSAEQLVSNAATLDGIDLGSGDKMCVMSGGTATDTEIMTSGKMWVYSGGVARDVEVESGGHLHISSGGVARDVEVDSRGYLYVYSGGTLNGVDLYRYGYIELYGKLTGQIYFGWGGLSFYEESVLDFDLTQTSAGASALVSGLSNYLDRQFTCTLTVSGSEANGSYCLAGDVAGFSRSITVVKTSGEELGTLTVDGGTQELDGVKYSLMLNDYSELCVFVGDPTPPNGPEEPLNNTLLIDKMHVNMDVTEAYGTHLTAAGQEVFLDQNGSIDHDGYHNRVGTDDEFDYAKIVLEHGAKLSFHAEATAAATFTVYSLTEKNGKYSLKKLQTLKLADKDKDGVFTADSSKPIQLQVSGPYYVSMQFKDKKAAEAYYNVTLNDSSEFYPLGDNSDDWGDMKTAGYAGAVGDLGVINAASLEADKTVIRDEWIGFGDKVDFKKFTLESAAELSLKVNAPDGPLKLTVCKLKETTKKDVTTYSQTNVKSVTVSAKQGAASLSSLQLEAGDYFFRVDSSDVKKSTGYSVQVTDSTFYTDGDNGWNNWLYDKKDNAVNEVMGSYVGTYSETWIDFDYDVYHDDYYNFVGFGDTCDYSEIYVDEEGLYNFKIDTTGKAKFTVYSMTRKNGKWTQKVLGSQTITDVNGASGASLKKDVKLCATTDDLRYFVSMQAADTKKSPEVYYNVMSFPTAILEADALSMPAEADALTMPDAAAVSFAELDDKSGWQSLLA